MTTALTPPWAELVATEYLGTGDALIATRIARLCGEPADSPATLALALAVRAVREGSTALDLARAGDVQPAHDEDETQENRPLREALPLPEPEEWLDAVRRSALVGRGVLHLEFGLVYLDRYACDERLIADRLLARDVLSPAPLNQAVAETVLDGLSLNEAQSAAVRSVLSRATTVLTGGPGMGKTHTIGGVISVVRAATSDDVRIALAAPTGKAAARMTQALEEQGVTVTEPATTLHRLLGHRPGSSSRFRHDRHNPLPHDLVVVDEASMLSLSMMARLVEALPDTTRLLLVGDPDQLASVEAGSVLRDVVDGLGPERGVVRLTEEFRLATRRADLARAFRRGDADAVLALLDDGAHEDGELRFVVSDEPGTHNLPHVLRHAERLRESALSGDRAETTVVLESARLLCAHRTGPYGTRRWNRLVEQSLAERWPEISHQEMYVGRPLLVTRNDYGVGLTNGDTGVVVRSGDHLTTTFTVGPDPDETLSPWRLAEIETMHAMTVHKAQGSQVQDVTVIVPPVGSRLLTREMLYTAVTRAQRTLTVVGTREAIRVAVESPATRSSGLRHRLAEPSATDRPR